MSTTANELTGSERTRGSLLATVQSSLTRDEFFAGLFILGCVNGLVGRFFLTARLEGWLGAILGFDMNVIVLFAFFAGVSLLLTENKNRIRLGSRDWIQPLDLAIGLAFVGLIILPVGPLSWVAVAGLSLYVFFFAKDRPFAEGLSDRQRAAMVLLALTVPMLWGRLFFQFFANFILSIDAMFANLALHTDRAGNTLSFIDGTGYIVISPACSSFQNISYVFLCWVAVTQWARHRWSPIDLVWLLFAVVFMLAVNVIRIAVIGQSHANYLLYHTKEWESILSFTILVFTVGFSVAGARRELLYKA